MEDSGAMFCCEDDSKERFSSSNKKPKKKCDGFGGHLTTNRAGEGRSQQFRLHSPSHDRLFHLRLSNSKAVSYVGDEG